jgi:hypothetical protein
MVVKSPLCRPRRLGLSTGGKQILYRETESLSGGLACLAGGSPTAHPWLIPSVVGPVGWGRRRAADVDDVQAGLAALLVV